MLNDLLTLTEWTRRITSNIDDEKPLSETFECELTLISQIRWLGREQCLDQEMIAFNLEEI